MKTRVQIPLGLYPGVAQFGRALRLGRRSRRFKSFHLDLEMYGLRVGIELIAYFNTSGSIPEFPKRQLDVDSWDCDASYCILQIQ